MRDSGLGFLSWGPVKDARELMYQPRMPATQTIAMEKVLKKMVCTVDGGRVGVGFAEGSTNGVAGERCVPSREERRSRNEAVDGLR